MLKLYVPKRLLMAEPTDGNGNQTPEEIAAAEATAAAEAKAAEEATAAAAAEAEAAAANEPDPLLAVLERDLNPEGVADIKPAPEDDAAATEAAAAAKAAEEKAKADAAAAAAVEAAKKAAPPAKPSARKRVTVIEDDPPIAAPVPIAQAPVAAPKPADAKDNFTAEQQDDIAEAEMAEQLFPDRYKGSADRLKEFYRGFDAKVLELQKTDANRSLDESDTEFQALLKSKPRIEQAHVKRVQREIGAREAGNRVKSELAPEIEEVKMQQRAQAAAPKVTAAQESLKNLVIDTLEKDTDPQVSDMMKRIKAGEDPKKVAADHPLEFEIAAREIMEAKALFGEYLNVAQYKATRLDLEKNEAQAAVVEFIATQCDRFKKNGGDMRVQDGRTFLTRAEFFAEAKKDPTYDPKKNMFVTSKYWTFDHADVGTLLATQAKINIKAAVKEEDERATRRGYVKKTEVKSEEPPKPKPEPTAITPPKAAPSIAKSGSIQTPPPADGIDIGLALPVSKK